MIKRDEFFPKDNDAGVIAFVNPGDNIVPDSISIQVAVSNFGLDTLFSFKTHLVINNDTFTTITVNDTLAPGDTVHISMGYYTFKRDSINNLLAWTSLPNNTTDQNFENDSFKITNQKTAMRGVYTIGGTSPDFNTFKNAIDAMNSYGIADSVRFRVRAGVYDEQLIIKSINGASQKNSIVFESESLDSSNVLLRYNSIYSDTNYVVFFNGCSGVTFRHITIQALNSTYGRVCIFENGASNNCLNNNYLLGTNINSSSSRYSVIGSFEGYTSDNNNQIISNRIENGSYGIYWYGYGNPDYVEDGSKINHNTFLNQYNSGIYASYQNNCVIHSNHFMSSRTYSSYSGIQVYRFEGKSRISSNLIDRSNNGRYGIYIDNTSSNGDTFLIVNNSISLGGTSNPIGIYSYSSNRVHFVHNSVYMGSSTNSSSIGVYIYYGSNNEFLNNIIEVDGDGIALDVAAPSALNKIDYNNYRSKGINLARWNAVYYSTLSSLKSASGKDSNSLSEDPLFTSSNDLHIKQIGLNGKATIYPAIVTDIDGETRDSLSRDIGSDEFNPPPLDAGVLSIITPSTPFPSDTQFVKVAIKNFD
ncbi:MAG: right-handed parallel beta-helix repeat-containing protein [Bacteroidia bacterium]